MDFIRIEWVPYRQIQARHTTTKPLTRYSYHKIARKDIPHIHVIRNKSGHLLLHKGIEAFNKRKEDNPNRVIPVYIKDQPNISQLEWTYRLFQSCMLEKVNYKLKHEYLTLLLKETKNDIQKICQNTGCEIEDLYDIIFEPTIPIKYKELALKYNRVNFINEIAKNPRLQNYRMVLYPAVFQRKNRLTLDKLKLFWSYLDAGYDLNVNSILAMQNLNQIVDWNSALKYYWDHLQFPDTQIMEGIYYYKGDKNTKINVRL